MMQQFLVHHSLERSAARYPGKTALIMEEVPTSYAELNAEANRIAHGLLQAGITKGDRVAFLGNNSRELLATHYGAAKIGAVFTPLNSFSPVPELRVIMEDARPRGLIVGTTHVERAAGLDEHIRELALCLACGSDGFHGSVSYDRYLAGQPESNPEIPVGADDDCVMLYTGSTTGRPKAVVSTHAARAATAVESALEYQVGHDDVGIHAAPFFHYGTLNLGIQTKLMMGCTIVCHERFSAERYLEAIDRHGITYLSGVPTLFDRVLSHPDTSRYDFRSVRKALYGASVMPDAVLARGLEIWPGIEFYQGYGSTEAGQVTVLRPADHATTKRRRTGVPMLMVDMKVVDESMHEVQAGALGELLVRSRQLFRCYHDKPELTAQVLVGGWYRTRDAAWMDEDGYMTIAGRLDDMIVTGGENVFPREVEDVLLQHPAVVDAAVFGVPDAEWVNAVCAAIVVRPGASASPEELIELCRSQLASYKKPRHIIFAPEIPKTVIGKPDRKALATLFTRSRQRAGEQPPRTEKFG